MVVRDPVVRIDPRLDALALERDLPYFRRLFKLLMPWCSYDHGSLRLQAWVRVAAGFRAGHRFPRTRTQPDLGNNYTPMRGPATIPDRLLWLA